MPVYRTRQESESYGYAVGVLVDGILPGRGAPGEIGNPASFSMPVLYGGLDLPQGAGGEGMVAAAVAAARRFEAQGVGAIIGSGRSLLLAQDAVREAVGIPVALSPIVLLPMIALTLPRHRPVVVVQGEADSGLEPAMKAFAGCTGTTLVFWRIDETASQSPEEIVDGIAQLFADRQDAPGAVICDLPGLVPHMHLLQERIRVPIFDMTTIAELMRDTVMQRQYQGYF